MRFPFAWLMRFLRSCPKVHVRFHTFTLMSSDMEAGRLFQAPPLWLFLLAPSLTPAFHGGFSAISGPYSSWVLEWKTETRWAEGERKGGRNTLRDAPFSPPELSISSLLPAEVHSFSYANPRCKCSKWAILKACVYWLFSMFRGSVKRTV